MTVTDPCLYIKGGQVSKILFWPFGPQFDPKIRGGGVAPLDPPLSDMEMG